MQVWQLCAQHIPLSYRDDESDDEVPVVHAREWKPRGACPRWCRAVGKVDD